MFSRAQTDAKQTARWVVGSDTHLTAKDTARAQYIAHIIIGCVIEFYYVDGTGSMYSPITRNIGTFRYFREQDEIRLVRHFEGGWMMCVCVFPADRRWFDNRHKW